MIRVGKFLFIFLSDKLIIFYSHSNLTKIKYYSYPFYKVRYESSKRSNDLQNENIII
jgi:hypothetical protein